ncbi:hypothetical protein Kpol_1037p52 [Vanderwaltozyma polyspora DSM 70294]|uniref:Protein kinase domain-containing protein n=1 Tax=Vanderwaltozyma polyspora (strain ATCC 22028 / DSM 70294 / BCRC 21397 / CBS 2163 / NBRC 10782 / NRRL Y-8283 / UCD 57-17) TaxID=436907 RepID=A7TJZ3_VANPO|nr:uncharacterized protein Kpol_1037p52 [Vanderwaltozyma polyspora DSM 70294]EDO17455.1 hypothetical protein Kpol_1037p52 [Vanderwaltozyma polyspora DSM 70294]
MIFSLDEELQNLRLDDGSAIIDDDGDDDISISKTIDEGATLRTHLSVDAKPIPSQKGVSRRRSSALEKFQVITPANSSKIKIPTIGTSPTSLEKSENLIESCIKRSSLSRDLYDFKPVRVLGKGAYGKVILVKDKSTHKLYAMKQLKKAEIIIDNSNKEVDSDDDNLDNILTKSDSDLSKRLERTFAEKTILSDLEHPNIVKLFYAFHDESKLYLLLQYIPGGELFFHLKEHGTLQEDTVAFYTAEISCALKFLHSKGIVYRDLKPENCLLNERGHLVLTDFGLSKIAVEQNEDVGEDHEAEGENITELYSIIGTPEYCAPEILQGLPYSQNCDWYSLGCLIYDMLIGKPPYTGVNHKIILNKIQKDKQGPKLPYYLSDGMKDVLGALLKKESKKRWDVDQYWKETNDKSGSKQGKKKNKKERTSTFQSHFIFRKVDWKLMESGESQKKTLGPIVPIITNWELAENFDSEFTSMSYEDSEEIIDGIEIVRKSDYLFKGFSYKASGSYLERYF